MKAQGILTLQLGWAGLGWAVGWWPGLGGWGGVAWTCWAGLEGAGYIEIVKGLGANNVLTESFDRNVLTETF